MKHLRILILTIVLSSVAGLVRAQCSASNTAFQSGETLAFDLYFNWKFIWIKVGNATWSVSQTQYNGNPAYRTRLITRGSERADKYFVMRDTLTAYSSLNLSPLYYEKNAKEGGQYRKERVWYTYPNGQCHLKMFYKRDDKPAHWKQFQSKYCAFDMLSMMMRARSFNPENYSPGHRQSFLMAEGKRAEWKTLLYRGKDNVKMEGRTTTYRCLVFDYLEKEDGKEKRIVTFYVTDDANHLPVRLDMYLNFGTAKAFLSGCRGLRNPMGALVKK